MASYKSGFDAPPRPRDPSRNRRIGTYMQPESEKQEHREADIAHISGQMEGRRDNATGQRSIQTGLPRPSMRDPPTLIPRSDTKPKAMTPLSYGFGRAPSKQVEGPGPAQLVLRGKSSRNVLRRKQSSIAQTTQSSAQPPISGSSSQKMSPKESSERRPSIESSLKSAEAYNQIFTRSRPQASTVATASPPIIPELDRYRNRPEHHAGPSRTMELPHKLSTQDLPPPFPTTTPVHSAGGSHHRYSGYSGSGYSASPSTRFSESPGPGAYSRDTTPTSMSSQSPGIMIPLKSTTTPRLRQGSMPLNRPPLAHVTRRRAASIPNEVEAIPVDPVGLPSLRESLTSSSSNSTVKGESKGTETEKKKNKKRLSPLPPSPPPRKSSQKFKKPQPGDFDSPSKSTQAPAQPAMDKESLVKPTVSRPRPTGTPPVRPSRDGTPDLQAQIGGPMVVQSNLAGISFSSDKRRSSLPRSANPSPLQLQTTFRPQQSTRLPSRNPSPSPVIPPSPSRKATPAPAGLGIIPDLRPRVIPPSSRGTTPSPSPATSKPRFGLFGRRTKTTPEIPTIDKSSRKGPAAGTGHEGYGKYANRGRSSSATGVGRGHDRNFSIGSSSQDSVASMPATYDPFLLHRMSPVIIAGGGEIIENRNNSMEELARTDSNVSLQMERPSHDSRGSGKSNLSHEVSRTTLWPSALPKEPSRRTSATILPKGRRASDSSDDGRQGSRLAMRRSIQRLNNNATALNPPRPLNIPAVGQSSSMTSLDTSLMSDDSRLETATTVMVRGRKGQLTKPKKLEKPRAKSPTKWNFFHRSKPAPKPTAPTMAVTVGKPVAKAIPHYAMMDSSDEQPDVDQADLEDLLRDTEAVALSNEELDTLLYGADKENMRRIENLRMNVPPLAIVTAPQQAPTQVFFSSPEPMTPVMPQTELHLVEETAPVRPSRLPQVGRIPKVISARPQATSPKSFSRPFARLSVAQQPPLANLDKESVAVGPSPPKPSTPELAQKQEEFRDSAVTKSSSDTSAPSHRDFLAFSPRKNSEATTSSSGGLSLQLAGTTAVIPEADAELEADEVWDEYDDLMENDNNVPVSATSSKGVPFQYESYESRRMRKSRMRPKESPTYPVVMSLPEAVNEPERISAITSSSVYSQDMNARLKDSLAAIPSPTTPMSFTDFFSGYEDRNLSFQEEQSSRPRRSSQSSSRKSGSSSDHSRTTSGMLSISEQENPSPISQVNLRVGSMTVSKWLTFGHVLFSPAREEISQPADGSSKPHSVLVIDGLGNGRSYY